ncbi:hypothetical protein XarbCFBP8152_10850 [Xanthomonas arboricola]|nr:hypothetical protein XarbCFBP8152_10850 [Xanthomonas arboricola]
MALNDSMRIVFMGGPVPVPVLEGGAYSGPDAVGVNVLLSVQPVGGMRCTCPDTARVRRLAGDAAHHR